MSGARNNHPTDSNNVRGDRGNADFDTRNSLSGYFIYDMPQLVHAVPRLTQGWQFNAFFSGQNLNVRKGDKGVILYVGRATGSPRGVGALADEKKLAELVLPQL